MYTFFLVVHAIVAAALVGVILMQRSEGGGLAGGGNPAGLMSARGAADFLTRTTTVLATLFVTLSIALAAIAITNRAPDDLDTSLARKAPAIPAAPPSGVPMAGGVPTPPAGEGPVVEDNIVVPAKPAAKPESEKTTPKPAVREAAPAPKVTAPKPEAAKPAAEKVAPPTVVVPPAVAPAETGNSPQ
jgi:preprotein translocase subunit SecG